MPSTSPKTRRALLAACGVSLPALLAGCGGDPTDGSVDAATTTAAAPTRTESPAPTPTATSSPTETPSPTEAPTATDAAPGDCERSWTPAVRWRRDLPDAPSGPFVGRDGATLYLHAGERLAAYAPNGSRLWRRGVSGYLVAVADRFYTRHDAGVDAYATDPWGRRWRLAVPEHASATVAVADGAVYVVESQYPGTSEAFDRRFDRLRAVDAGGGETLWRVDDLPGAGEHGWTLHATDRGVYVAHEDGALLALDPRGHERWRTTVGRGGNLAVDLGPVAAGTLYVGTEGSTERLAAVDADTGRPRWTVDGYASIQAVVDDTVVCSGGDATHGIRIAGVDAATGRRRWRREYDANYVVGDGALTDRALYVVLVHPTEHDGEARVHALDPVTGCVYGVLGLGTDRIGAPVAVDGRVAVVAGDPSALYGIEPPDGPE